MPGPFRNGLTIILLLSMLALPVRRAAGAETWPAQPVRIILASSPGGLPDVIARMLADRFSRAFNKQFQVENVEGGGGLLGPQRAARATPDGYTLFFSSNTHLASNQFMYKSLPYDPDHDFTPIALVGDSSPLVISVTNDLPAGNLSELIALAKTKPGKLSYATTSPRGAPGLTGEWLKFLAGIDIVQIPYKTTSQAVVDTVAGRTEIIIISLPVIEPYVKDGKLRTLAVTSNKRFPGLDEVPAANETVPGFGNDGWMALVAPTGTPADIVRRLNREADAFLKDPVVIERLRLLGMATNGAGDQQSIAEFLRAARENWAQIVKDLSIQPQ